MCDLSFCSLPRVRIVEHGRNDLVDVRHGNDLDGERRPLLVRKPRRVLREHEYTRAARALRRVQLLINAADGNRWLRFCSSFRDLKP